MGGKFPYSAWQTYLEAFDEVVVVSRGRPLVADAKLSVSSGPGVRHVLIGGRRGLARALDYSADRAALMAELAKADAVVSRLPSEIGLAAFHGAKTLGIPAMIEVVACPWDALWYHGSLVSKVYAPILTARTRAAVKQADMVRYVTEHFLQGRYPSSGAQIHASNVMLAKSDPQTLQARLPRLASLPGRKVILGTIGNLSTELKGVATAIEALSHPSLRERDFEYRVLGEGDPQRYRAMAAAAGIGEKIRFDGVLPAGDAVFAWLDEVDIYLQPSFQEGLPRAVIEALSRGAISIGSTAGGTPELLKPERLHAPGDAAALTARIVAALAASPSDLAEEARLNVQKASAYERDVLLARRIAFCRRLADAANPKVHQVLA
ncbi:glycosyltransferase family 4 protein [uncultured Devosia sp.]|uniref:glycosyltransferase family 4 protein n=1 Tax=uncultured Devosia sp. TaxID=211434 RepID=UPI0035CC7490